MTARNYLLLAVLFLPFLLPAAMAQEAGWERMENPSTFDLWDVVFTDSLNGHAAGNYGAVLRTTDGGATWTQQLVGQQRAMRAIHFFDSSTGITCGFNGTLLRSSDAGASWDTVDLGLTESLPALIAHARTVWIGGAEGTLLKSTDTGLHWERIAMPERAHANTLSFPDVQHGWCSSPAGTLLRSVDGGTSWQPVPPPSQMPITALLALSADSCIIACYDGKLYLTGNGGVAWLPLEGYRTQYHHIHRDDQGRIWGVGKLGAIVRMDSTGRFVLQHLTGERELFGMRGAPGGALFAVGSSGSIYRLLPASK